MDRPETDKCLRENIAKLRGERAQEEMADILKIPRSTYRNWEDGSRKIKAADIAFLSVCFGVSSDWLLGLTDDKSPKTEIRAMRKYTGSQACIARGLSIFSNMDECLEATKLPSLQKLGQTCVAKITLTAKDGVIHKGHRTDSHYSWWRTRDFDLNTSVEPVKAPAI